VKARGLIGESRGGVERNPTNMSAYEPPLITSSRLVEDFTHLGVRPGGVIMLHASVRATGWVVGGPDVILHALREVLGPDGTLMM
jgi:aminoglycoside N3'-acetyltransferase